MRHEEPWTRLALGIEKQLIWNGKGDIRLIDFIDRCLIATFPTLVSMHSIIYLVTVYAKCVLDLQ